MDEELLAEFLTESNENLDSIEEQLLALESDPGNAETVDGIFRVVHTVKGSCGFLGLKRLEQVAHAGENLLGKIRATRFEPGSEIISLLLENTDAIKELICGIEESGSEPDMDYTPLCTRLAAAERLIDMSSGTAGNQVDAPVEATVEASEAATDESQPDAEMISWLSDMDDGVKAILAGAALHTPEAVLAAGFEQLRGLDGMKPAIALKVLGVAKTVAAEPAATEKAAVVDVVVGVEAAGKSFEVEQAPEVGSEQEIEQTPAVEVADNGGKGAGQSEAALPPAPAQSNRSPAAQPERKQKSEGSIRVDVALLDELMTQVGELVLTRNRLMRLADNNDDPELLRTSRGINQITSRLQEKLLHTRMQPISNLWSSVPRLLRDISRQLGKQIRVTMEGEETELDRTILAALKDPMTHIIRNSCDHGIEEPDVRRSRSKPDAGTIALSARQESGFIVIDIVDDGGGIDASRVRDKAVHMNVVTADKAAAMSDKALLQLIFHPGLSTAEKVSNLSGRGVGMDVVRSQIESVGGTVEIDSTPGKCTSLNIRIPLTLAIIPAMIIESAGQHFAIPQMVVQELISAEASEEGWEEIAGKPFYMLRGRLLPILSLADSLGMESNSQKDRAVVVINVGAHQFGISVGEVLGSEEIVVKPLGRHFHHLDVYGGCSILGDGMVVPIIDCVGITRSLRQEQEDDVLLSSREEEEDLHSKESQYILIFTVGKNWYAIPMALVERIEEIEPQSIEQSGRREVLQYRGEVIQVVRLSQMLEVESEGNNELEPCLIIADQGRRLCIVVDSIIDIIQQRLEIHLDSNEPCFHGTTVVDGRSTEVIDIFEVIRKAVPNWFSAGGERRKRVQKVLYADDAIFFRNLVIPILEGMGCEVITARNGREACDLLAHQTPDLLLTDLEMPELDGAGLATWVRQQPRLAKLPIICLSTLEPGEYKDRSHLFDTCLKKLDRDQLVEALTALLGRKRQSNGDKAIDAEFVRLNQEEP